MPAMVPEMSPNPARPARTTTIGFQTRPAAGGGGGGGGGGRVERCSMVVMSPPCGWAVTWADHPLTSGAEGVCEDRRHGGGPPLRPGPQPGDPRPPAAPRADLDGA